MAHESKAGNPGVWFPPPLLFVGGLFIAWLLETRFCPLPLFDRYSTGLMRRGVGYFLAIAGLALAAWGITTFRRHRTAIIPHKSASTLVQSGPYQFSRNPMYTGMTIAYLGGVVVLDSGWAMILLPVSLLLLYRFVIQREERYLSAEFGTEYDAYRSRVKRWI